MGDTRHLAEELRWLTEAEVGAADVLAAGFQPDRVLLPLLMAAGAR